VTKKILHPYLFALYPVLALLAYNIEEIKVQPAIRPAVIMLLAAGLGLFLLARVLKDPAKAALLVTLGLILFFSYGQVYNLLKLNTGLGAGLGRHRLLLPLWLALFTAGVIWVLRRRIIPDTLTQGLNVVGGVVLILPLAQILLFGFRTLASQSTAQVAAAQAAHLQLPAGNTPPDIYYFILDAYARDDALLNDYNLDTRPFLKELEQMGFFIARCSQSNYAQTQLSLSSSLNMDYLQALNPEYNPGSSSRVGIAELIHHSAARLALEGLGYKTVAFETGFKGTQLEDADIYLSPGGDQMAAAQLLGGLTSFEDMLIRTSAGLALIDSRSALPQALRQSMNNPNRSHYDLIRYNLDQLEKMPGKASPKFVFVHLVIPHPPYVFNADGSFVEGDKPDDPGYQDQIRYLNRAMIPLLGQLIAESSSPPVIIIQGDHGAIQAPPKKRLAILNAYYLPGAPAGAVADDISPVNTFRTIFNLYFKGEYSLLENSAYFSVYSRPYEFTIIPNQRAGCP
jgi:hypothetical protein